MNPLREHQLLQTRRQFFATGVSSAVGCAALTSLMNGDRASAAAAPTTDPTKGPTRTHHAPKAKHVIYLHMVGGPPQMDLFDYKPRLREWYDRDLPASVRGSQRLTTMTSGQARFPIAPSKFSFARRGQCGMWMTELLPNFSRVVDDVCFIRS